VTIDFANKGLRHVLHKALSSVRQKIEAQGLEPGQRELPVA
jgi:hypothetical protein